MRLRCKLPGVLVLSACAGLLPVSGWSQSVISAHSGTIHYTEGTVLLEGTPVHPKFAQFLEVKNDQTLTTKNGRAEVLLTPGVFLRLQENSSIRMVSNKLSDTRVEIPSGVALLEVAVLLPANRLTIQARGAEIALVKGGLYRIDSDRASLRVFDGRADVTSDGGKMIAKKGHEIDLKSEPLASAKFSTKETDSFYKWSSSRASYIAAANETSARVASNSGYSSSYSQSGSQNSWMWNPYYGMFTFLPANGMYASPFGPTYYSPAYVTYYAPAQNGAASSGTAANSAVINSNTSSRSSSSSPTFPSAMGGGARAAGGSRR